MQRDSFREKLLTRRALIFGGLQGAMFSILAGRMYQLQVVDSARYRLLARENSINLRLLAPPRGRILDRHGKPLAENRQIYRALIVADEASDAPGTLVALGRLVPIDEADRVRVLRDLRRVHSFVPVVIKSDLSWDEMARIEVAAPELAGISVEQGLTRNYPLGPIAAHAIGYVGDVSARHQHGNPLFELPDFRVGKSGIERSANAELVGTAGTEQIEVNAYGREVRELSRVAPQPGKDVVTTLDAALQEFAFHRCSEEPSVASVTLDAVSGEVLAHASVPSFDPAAFSTRLSPEMWHALSTDPRHPLQNKVIAGLYPPGSTFKPTVAMAALTAGVITPQTTFFCPGYYRLGKAVFHCWRHGGHGTLDLHDAIKESCDVYFYHTAKRVGIDRLAAMARRFGYGAPVGIDIPGELGGLIPTPAWKKAATHRPWEPGETLITGIGQGFVLVTPLQIAVMVARLLTGKAIVPRLIGSNDREVRAPAPVFDALGLDPHSRAVVISAMVGVVNEKGGTGYALRIANPEFAMGGKSGTSQVHRITAYERAHGALTGEKVPWKDRDHALFVGFAPVASPRYVCATVVEHGGTQGGEGAQAAGPIVRDTLLTLQQQELARRNPGQLAASKTPPAPAPPAQPVLAENR